jgi:hypothetical protein
VAVAVVAVSVGAAVAEAETSEPALPREHASLVKTLRTTFTYAATTKRLVSPSLLLVVDVTTRRRT